MNRNDNEMRRSEGDTSEKLPAPTVTQPSMPQQVEKSPPKKKRKSPAVPWKKPKDMPKRPLSAYNLFFKAEREKLIEKISAGPRKGKTAEDEETTEEPDDEEDAAAIVECVDSPHSASSGKKQMKTSGLGFANLAKTIASKWKTLDPKEKAPFEERASTDKQRYDVEVAKWRVKQKAEQSLKKAADEANPPKEAPKEPQSTSMTLSPGLVEALSAVEPYPAEWFDVVGSTGGQAVDPSRPFEDSHTTFESSQRSLDQSGHQRVQQEYPSMGFSSQAGYHVGPLQGVPFPSEQANHQAALPPWAVNDMRRAEDRSREIPFVVNLHPKYSQTRESLAPHEFAQALPGESVARLSPQFRSTRPPSPQLRFVDRDEHRMMDSYSWGITGNWGQQGNLSGLPPQQSTYQFDPLPYDTSSGHQYPSINRSFSILPQGPEGQIHQFGGSLPETGARRHTWAATEPSRIRHMAASSLEPMPQLYRPENPPGQLDSRSPLITHNSQTSSEPVPLAPGQGNAGVQEGKPESHGDPSSLPQFQTSHSTSGQQSRFQEISQRLDDETIDFITGLPFP